MKPFHLTYECEMLQKHVIEKPTIAMNVCHAHQQYTDVVEM